MTPEEKLITYIEWSLGNAIEGGYVNEDASWVTQEGILLDYKQAALLVEMFKKQNSDATK